MTPDEPKPSIDSDDLSGVLAELDAIANAAMTQSQRETRAAPALAGVGLGGILSALAREELPWNQSKAAAYGVSLAHWQQALAVAGLPGCDSLGGLLQVIHRAETIAAMFRAGYRPQTDDSGHVSWAR